MRVRVCGFDSWSWTVLLRNDAHRKPVTSTTAALIPFVTYLPTLPRMNMIMTVLFFWPSCYQLAKDMTRVIWMLPEMVCSRCDSNPPSA
jgi:hypothetical protein